LGRETIRPEVCRTFNFGEKGASEGQWYKTHLANVKLASEKVDWGNEGLSYLDADAYERAVAEAVDAATPARDPSQITRAEITNPKGVFKVLYKDEAEFRRLVHLKMNDGRHEVMLVPRDAAKVTKTFAEYLASVDGGKAEVLGL
jgi:alpha-1,3-mannosyl-glycoprotein beta-1,2-N-acetylglucosaminyltransferase